jgi:hypothetical protein
MKTLRDGLETADKMEAQGEHLKRQGPSRAQLGAEYKSDTNIEESPMEGMGRRQTQPKSGRRGF